MDFISIEYAKQILSTAAQANLTEKIIILAVCFWYVKKTFKQHFENIEKGLGRVASSVSDLGASLNKLEVNHSSRIKALEEWKEEQKIKLTGESQGE